MSNDTIPTKESFRAMAPHVRYSNDPQFRNLVQSFLTMIRNGIFDETEISQAKNLASKVLAREVEIVEEDEAKIIGGLIR